jgi:hypothetical protein
MMPINGSPHPACAEALLNDAKPRVAAVAAAGRPMLFGWNAHSPRVLLLMVLLVLVEGSVLRAPACCEAAW